ncbi:GNAT family N-acetyltransferase [Georgenia wangjunii]|uniref:GNAT family N-acetyltransferase n=1 Tax=Georgenia wangjunii TaxID=3117730 RepID=UPI002F264C17
MDAQVRNNIEAQQVEAVLDGEVVGVAAYTVADGVMTFTHTEVDLEIEDNGIGSALARAGLDDARERGLTVVPQCSFIAGWIDRHPEYADLTRGTE